MSSSPSTRVTTQEKEISVMNTSSSTRTTRRGVNKIGFLSVLALFALVYLATPLTALACNGNNNNNNNNNANSINGINNNNSCTLVDDGSGNTKLKLSGQLDTPTKNALDKALKKDPNIQNNDLSQALDCSGNNNSIKSVGIGINRARNSRRSLVCIQYEKVGNFYVCKYYA